MTIDYTERRQRENDIVPNGIDAKEKQPIT